MIHPVLVPIILQNRMIDSFCCRFSFFAQFPSLSSCLSSCPSSWYHPGPCQNLYDVDHHPIIMLTSSCRQTPQMQFSFFRAIILVSSCRDEGVVLSSWYHPAWLVLLSSFTASSVTSACNKIWFLLDLSSWHHPAFPGEGVRWLIILVSSCHHPGKISKK